MQLRNKYLAMAMVAVAALLACSCSGPVLLRASAAAAMAPQRPSTIDQPSACASGTSPLLVRASEAHFWLTHPAAFDFRWLTTDSAALRSELRRQAAADESDSEWLGESGQSGAHVLAVCVPDSDRAMADIQFATDLSAMADSVDSVRVAELQAATAALRTAIMASGEIETEGANGEHEQSLSNVGSDEDAEQMLNMNGDNMEAADAAAPQLAQDSERNSRLRQLAKRFQRVNTRIRSGRADLSDVAELTKLQEALELEYSRASPAEQKKFRSIKQKLAGMLADMKSELQQKLRISAEDSDANASNHGVNDLNEMQPSARASSALDSAFTTQQYATPVGFGFSAPPRWGGRLGGGWGGGWGRGGRPGFGAWGARPALGGWTGGWGGRWGGGWASPRRW